MFSNSCSMRSTSSSQSRKEECGEKVPGADDPAVDGEPVEGAVFEHPDEQVDRRDARQEGGGETDGKAQRAPGVCDRADLVPLQQAGAESYPLDDLVETGYTVGRVIDARPGF